MNFFAALSLINSAVAFILASFVYHLNRREHVNKIFAILCLIFGYWAFIEFMIRQSESFETARFWLKWFSLCTFVPAVLLHFTLVFVNKSKWLRRFSTYISIYAPALLFTIIELVSNSITVGPIREYWGYTGEPNESSWLYWLSHIWAFVLGFTSFFLCLFYYQKTDEIKERRKAKYVAIALIIPIISALLTEVIAPSLNYRIPEFSITSFSWLAIIVAFAIWRFELFSLDPMKAGENIVSTMTDALFICDSNLKMVYVNKAVSNTLLYDTSVLLGEAIEMVISEKDHINFKEIIQKVAKNTFKSTEVELKKQDGTIISMKLSSTVLKDKGSEVVGYVFIAHDLTQIKINEERLNKALSELKYSNYEMKRFIQIGSHHLQEPLRSIASYVQLLEQRYKGKLDAEADECIDFAVEGSVWMKHLISDLVSYSDMARKNLAREPVDCNEIIKRAITNLQSKINDLKADIHITNEMPTLEVDKGEFVLLFQDLFGNSLKFCDKQPKITVLVETMDNSDAQSKSTNSINSNGDMWVFSIIDNGIGIPKEYHNQIFDVFEKLHPRTEYYGTGIGLSMCKKIVERHNGSIWVESEEGRGSTFKFTVPIVKRI